MCLSLASTKVPEMYDKSPPAVKMHPRRCSDVDFNAAPIRSALADIAVALCEQRPDHIFAHCESPIEDAMVTALWLRLCLAPGMRGVIVDPSVFDALPASRELRPVMAPQVAVGPYRVDAMVALRGADGDAIRVAVECDGHDFHEKTKQQSARDKSRDRDLASRGVVVLRFTGSEIWNDLAACAGQVCDVIEGVMVDRMHRDSAAGLVGAEAC